MRTMTKSPIATAREALEAAAAAGLPLYWSPYSPKKYTVHQMFAVCVLKRFFKTDYRGIRQFLHDLTDLRDAIGLTSIPDHTTIFDHERRLLQTVPPSSRCLDLLSLGRASAA